jgi:hypothetical protein
MIYGTPPINVEDDTTDRIGIRKLVLSQTWQASRWPMTIEELDEEEPEVPGVPGGMALVGHQTRRAGGGLKTFWTFEGINGDGKSVTFKTRGNSPDYSFEPGFAQKSILLHPNFRAIRDKYQGVVSEGEVTWPDTIQGNTGATGLSGSGSKDQDNPMFGTTDYFDIEGTYTYRYAVTDESQIPRIEGRIFEAGQIPGRARTFGGDKSTKRNYLGAGTPYQRRGTVVEVQEIYWLSREGGWNEAIYGASAKGSGVEGLQTGSL